MFSFKYQAVGVKTRTKLVTNKIQMIIIVIKISVLMQGDFRQL